MRGVCHQFKRPPPGRRVVSHNPDHQYLPESVGTIARCAPLFALGIRSPENAGSLHAWMECLRGDLSPALGAEHQLDGETHEVVVSVSGGDPYGVEVDVVTVPLVHPLETGTVTIYAVASSLVHRPTESVAGLWAAANVDLNHDLVPEPASPPFGVCDDADNFDIADAYIPGICTPPLPGKDVAGPWASFPGLRSTTGRC